MKNNYIVLFREFSGFDTAQPSSGNEGEDGNKIAIDCILDMQEDAGGREDCKYGDTDYDSPSAVYGYNTCLNNIKEIIKNRLRSWERLPASHTPEQEGEKVQQKFGDHVGEDQYREMVYQRNIQNPYSTGSPSFTGFEKGFEECYNTFSKAELSKHRNNDNGE